MRMSMTRLRIPRGASFIAGRTTAGLALVAGTSLLGAGIAVAVDVPTPPPGTTISTVPPVRIDAADPDLKLSAGATLVPGRVLDIGRIVEDEGGEERRQETNTDVRVALQAEVLFGKDSAVLSDTAKTRITALAEEIRKSNPAKVTVLGYTDNLGSSAHGDVLSRQRADAVHAVLVGVLGSAVSFDVRGLGERDPVADNGTEEGRKKNRRVEIVHPRG
ncbi:OmpA family protein [Embleya sp. NPDC008237]|uniref:OmpA family protein n=1 Tax=Embleya sp. NPDC008237 TaxID=3363978 RepID=UPI0036ED89E9